MADGVRIIAVDERLRGAIVEVPHPTRMLGTGGRKMYRFVLDGEGATFVSTVVWDRIREIMAIDPKAPRFLEVGRTARPPDQIINGERQARPIYRHRIGHGIDTFSEQLVPILQLK
jgi:hypothetical protein